jgi:hypothetical protein
VRVPEEQIGWKPVFSPHMGIRELWATTRRCKYCNEEDRWAFHLRTTRAWISGGRPLEIDDEPIYE